METLKDSLISHECAVEYLELHDVLGPNVIGSKCEGEHTTSKWGRNGKPPILKCEGRMNRVKFKGKPRWSRLVLISSYILHDEFAFKIRTSNKHFSIFLRCYSCDNPKCNNRFKSLCHGSVLKEVGVDLHKFLMFL